MYSKFKSMIYIHPRTKRARKIITIYPEGSATSPTSKQNNNPRP